MNRYNPEYLDEQERNLIESIDVKEVPAMDNEKVQQLQQAAQQYVQEHSTKMNIRIDKSELDRIKSRAAKEGLKYQSFVKSVLHKYITNQLVEK